MIAFVLLIAMISLSCQALSNTNNPGSSQNGTNTSVLFKDDFSSTSSGWDRHSDTSGSTDYYHEAFRIQITNQTQYYLWANPNVNFPSDVIVDVDAALEDGAEVNDIGVICRYQDSDNFYFLTISSDGFYGISKFSQGKESLIVMSELGKNTSAIHSGKTTNHIQVKCIGEDLTLSANGTELTHVTDADLTKGEVGLLAGTYDQGNVSVLFDNFIVTKP